ncbi:hypothetical protein [Mesorhizobium carmichaelinearum]|uniref:hypothetical protein n=1 Tax=Mesorhizobium carmichaelinearum TaxID=1208188 RepID=UPI001AEC9FD9|nr:hypothetical protein [Mesorhizobium carmichaelinearum]
MNASDQVFERVIVALSDSGTPFCTDVPGAVGLMIQRHFSLIATELLKHRGSATRLRVDFGGFHRKLLPKNLVFL